MQNIESLLLHQASEITVHIFSYLSHNEFIYLLHLSSRTRSLVEATFNIYKNTIPMFTIVGCTDFITYKKWCFQNAINNSINMGDGALARYLWHWYSIFPTQNQSKIGHSMDIAVQKNNLDLVVWLRHMGHRYSKQTLSLAITAGNLRICQFVYKTYNEWDLSHDQRSNLELWILTYATQNNIPMLEIIYQIFQSLNKSNSFCSCYIWPENVCLQVANECTPDTLDFLLTHTNHWVEKGIISDDLFENAVDRNISPILAWIVKRELIDSLLINQIYANLPTNKKKYFNVFLSCRPKPKQKLPPAKRQCL